jgi:hypothetical protein
MIKRKTNPSQGFVFFIAFCVVHGSEKNKNNQITSVFVLILQGFPYQLPLCFEVPGHDQIQRVCFALISSLDDLFPLLTPPFLIFSRIK